MASIDTGARNTEKWGKKNKAYLTFLIAENRRIICTFATVNEEEH